MMVAVTTDDQTQFCDIERWQREESAKHTIRRFTCPDGTKLMTTISRSYKAYKGRMKRSVLDQLDVDEETLREVIRSGKPPHRPAPTEADHDELPRYVREALGKRGGLTQDEIDSLTLEEAEHLKTMVFTRPNSGYVESRAATLDDLAQFRSD